MIQYEVQTQSNTEKYHFGINSEIENLLSSKIEECFLNKKFAELPISIIYRIVEKSAKKGIESDKLYDFIKKSVSKFCVLFRFLEVGNLSDDRLDEICEFYSETDASSVEYFNYMKCNLDVIKKMIESKKNFQLQLKSTEKNSKKVKKQLESKIDEQQNQMNELQLKIIQLQNQLKTNEIEKNQLKNQLVDSEKAKQQIEQEKNQLKNQLDDSEKTKQKIESNGIQLHKQFEELKESKNDLQKQLDLLKNGTQDIIKSLVENPLTKAAVVITSSSIFDSSMVDKNVLLFNKDRSYFSSKNVENSWICFDFTQFRITPTSYTIKSIPYETNNYHPKSWVIEAWNDKINWEVIDKQDECQHLNGKCLIHTFDIMNKSGKKFRYFRMKQTGINWGGNNYLEINSFDIHGGLFKDE